MAKSKKKEVMKIEITPGVLTHVVQLDNKSGQPYLAGRIGTPGSIPLQVVIVADAAGKLDKAYTTIYPGGGAPEVVVLGPGATLPIELNRLNDLQTEVQLIGYDADDDAWRDLLAPQATLRVMAEEAATTADDIEEDEDEDDAEDLVEDGDEDPGDEDDEGDVDEDDEDLDDEEDDLDDDEDDEDLDLDEEDLDDEDLEDDEDLDDEDLEDEEDLDDEEDDEDLDEEDLDEEDLDDEDLEDEEDLDDEEDDEDLDEEDLEDDEDLDDEDLDEEDLDEEDLEDDEDLDDEDLDDDDLEDEDDDEDDIAVLEEQIEKAFKTRSKEQRRKKLIEIAKSTGISVRPGWDATKIRDRLLKEIRKA